MKQYGISSPLRRFYALLIAPFALARKKATAEAVALSYYQLTNSQFAG